MEPLPTTSNMEASRPTLTGLTFVAVYVDDLDAALSFYTGLLGLEKSFDMGPSACYLRLSDEIGLYVEGGNAPAPVQPKQTRASFGLTAGSVVEMYRVLAAAGVPIVQSSGPQEMGGGQGWFQCVDPAGNIIEIVGPM
jgi:predicted enzyme related to lactoylglutathione lyase